jgi:PPE-repeat protein
MDFGALPPEINSALMYAGPGSGPMLAAAAAWESLSGELATTAASWQTVITSLLDGPWQGPSSAAMAAATTPQIEWLSTTAVQAQESAARAAAAASAYEAAFLGTVPPAEVAANRALLAALLATNFLGQNTAAIAATEAQYGEMWAQDAATMYGYSGASAQAASVPAWTPQGIAQFLHQVGQEINAQVNAFTTALSQQGQFDIPRALLRLAGLTNENPGFTNPQNLLGITGTAWNGNGDGFTLNGIIADVAEGLTGSQTMDGSTPFDAYIRLVSPFRLTTTALKDIQGLAAAMVPAAKAAEGVAAGAASAAANALPNIGSALGGAVGALGNAAKVGAISVPASWASGAPVATPINVALNGLAGVAAAEPATSAVGGVPFMSGGGAARTVANFAAPRYGFKPTVIAAPPSGG